MCVCVLRLLVISSSDWPHSTRCLLSAPGFIIFEVYCTPHSLSLSHTHTYTHRLKLVLTMVCKVHLVYQRRIWGSSVTKLRSSSNLLLLWPSFAASFPAVVDSPTLSSLVFTGHTYTHTTHTIHSLRRGEHATADLTHISSTVSHHDGSKDAKSEDSNKSLHQNGLSLTVDQTNTDPPHGVAHHCIPTDMPKFLITYQPKVSFLCVITVSFLFCIVVSYSSKVSRPCSTLCMHVHLNQWHLWVLFVIKMYLYMYRMYSIGVVSLCCWVCLLSGSLSLRVTLPPPLLFLSTGSCPPPSALLLWS